MLFGITKRKNMLSGIKENEKKMMHSNFFYLLLKQDAKNIFRKILLKNLRSNNTTLA